MRTHEGPAWIDGVLRPVEEASVSVLDPAFQSGLGAFETIAVRDGRTLEADEHLDRLARCCLALGIALPPRETLGDALAAVASHQKSSHGWLKIVATAGGRIIAFGGPMDPAEVGRPASAVLLPWHRALRDPLAGLKTLNYAANALGLAWAAERGADEGLWRNTRGHLVEGCASNLFLVRRGKLYTPGTSEGILPGVVRGLALAAAREHGIVIHEGRVRLERLERADEAFLTSSLRGVRPLVRYGRRTVGKGEPGPVTGSIALAVAAGRRLSPQEGGGT